MRTYRDIPYNKTTNFQWTHFPARLRTYGDIQIYLEIDVRMDCVMFPFGATPKLADT